MARSRDSELRPLLLRVQTRAFADAPRHDAVAIASFQAMALGLIPLVPDDVLAEAAAILREVPDTPPCVLHALNKRLLRTEDAVLDEGDDAPGPSLAAVRLLPALTEVGTDVAPPSRPSEQAGDPFAEPARSALLRRAARFRQLDTAARLALLEELGPFLAGERAQPPEAPPLDPATRDAAFAGDRSTLEDAAARRFGWGHEEGFDLRAPAGQEHFVLTLVALGLGPEDCVRAILSVEDALSRSVADVFRLAQLARSTAREVAQFVVENDRSAVTARRKDRPAERRSAPPAVAGQLRADGRADPVTTAAPSRSSPPASGSIGPFGRRSTATTGRDRT